MANITDSLNALSAIDVYDSLVQYSPSEAKLLDQLQKATATGDSATIAGITRYARRFKIPIVTDIASAAETADTAFQVIFANYQGAIREVRDALTAGKISSAYAAELRGASMLRQDFPAQIQAAVDKALVVTRMAQATLQGELAKIANSTTGDPTTELLTELRVTRAWGRLKPLLDASDGDFSQYIRLLGETTDQYELLALLNEGPAYLELHGVKSASKQVNQRLGQIYPAIATAAKDAHAAEKFEIVIRTDAGILTRITGDGNGFVDALKSEGYVDPTAVNYF
ncbi:MAG TPA: hypothetical protein VGM94_17450 [Galbitalea sp.]